MEQHTQGNLHSGHMDFFDDKGEYVGTVYPYSDERHHYNLQRIVMCWNMHDELVAQLKKATDALAGGLWDYGPGQDEHDKCDEIISECRALIAKIEEMK